MAITYDVAKNLRNIMERGISFDAAARFEFDSALYEFDQRREYKEVRIRAIGMLDGRLHVLVFTQTLADIRIISLRKANSREVAHYESQTRR